jgi:hypothetical protein
MSNYITFTDETEERIEIFSIYNNKLDSKIVKEASKNDLYLMGGTAIEIWLNKLKLDKWRKRSDDDFDLLTNRASNNQINNFYEFLKESRFKKETYMKSFKFNNVTVDLLNNNEEPLKHDKIKLKDNMFHTLDSVKIMSEIISIKLMSPVYLLLNIIEWRD